jgi:diguanylate cyclase (GGDEF)-like protein
VNDTYGHAIGDELLVAIVRRLRHAVRQGDTLARLSGDEFVLLVRGVHTAEEATRVTETLLERFHSPFSLSSVTLSVRASIGFSLYPDDGVNAKDLLQLADKAMYRVKAREREGAVTHALPEREARGTTELQRRGN